MSTTNKKSTETPRQISALAEFCRQHLLDEKWLLAPSRRIGQQWLDQVARAGQPVVNVRLHTLTSFALELAGPRLNGRQLLSPLGRVVLAGRLLRQLDTGYLGGFRPSLALAERLAATLHDLRMASLEPDDLERGRFEAPAKGRELIELLRAYRAELKKLKLVDDAKLFRLAGTELPAGVLVLAPADLDLGPVAKIKHEVLPVDEPPAPDFTDAFNAVGETNEVREVLRRCLANGWPLDEVEVLHTDTETYVAHFYELAAALDVPVTFAEGIPVRYSRPGRALAAWLAWVADDFPQPSLVAMIRDGLLEGLSGNLAGSLRVVPIGFGRDRYLAQLDEQSLALERQAAELETDEDGEPRVEHRAALQRRRDALAALRAPVARLLALANRPLLDAADQFLKNHARCVNELDNYAREVLQARLAELKSWSPAEAEVREWLPALLRETRVRGEGSRPGHLYVTGWERGGHSGRPHTFIVGLDAGRFPPSGRQDPVLLDSERKELSPDLATVAAQRKRAAKNFEQLRARLRGTGTASYSCRDVADDSELFPGLAMPATRTAASAPASEAEALSEDEWWLWRLCAAGPVSEPAKLVGECFPWLGRGMCATFDGIVTEAGPDLDPAVAADRLFSPHRLETVGTCPLRYFYHYALGLQEPEELEIDPERWLPPVEFGQLLHEVFHRHLHDCVALEKVLQECIARYREKFPPPNEGVLRRDCRRLERAIRIFAAEQFEGKPVDFEREISGVPVALPDRSTIHLRGRIDRVDQTAAGLALWDYKTGGTFRYRTKRDDPFNGGRVLQHAIYIALAQAHYGKPVAQFGYFFPTEKGRGERFVFTPAQLGGAPELLAELRGRIARGEFPATEKLDDCTYCDYPEHLPAMNPPDHKEREKIVKQLDTTMLVEAAAGTGKTTAMVSRIVALVKAGKCGLETLAAVTFTRKAAAELREKLQKELPGAEQCFVGTVHSFCGRLLRERPVEAGVDPDFEELDDERDARLRQQAWETFGNELFAKDDPVLDELDELGLALADLRSAFEKFADYPDVEDWPAPEAPAPQLKPAVKALREYAAHMEKNLPDRDATDELAGLFRRVLRMMRSHDLKRHSEVAEVFEQFKPDRKCTQKSWPNGKEQALREHERSNKFCAEVAGPFVTAWRAHRYPTVLRVLQRAQAVYDRQRQAAHGLNFQDLLLRAAELLRERPEVRQYFRRRFTHVLVDEFQDTDPVQAEVMLLLTADNPHERDWRKCRPVPGSLFLVGDPKQSIYRFRRADIVTYNTVKQIIGTTVTLSANFRSAQAVVDWVNKTFERDLFPVTANETAPAYVAFKFARDTGPVVPGVFQLPVAGKNQDQIAGNEADFIARHIRASKRPASDFLIITRQKKRLSVYADALQKLGIAHEVTGGSSLGDVHELDLWHAALRAALEPDNPVAVVAALRSELFGFSDPELYAHRRAGGRFDWRSDTTGTIGEAFAVMRRHAEWLGSLAPMIALERVAQDLGLLPLAAAGGDVEAGSVAKAIELLHAGQTDWPTAAEMIAQLAQLTDHDGAPATAPTGDAVRVMNLHKVKGLQAQVVFLADPSGASEHEVELHVDRRGVRVTGYLALYGAPNAFGSAALLAHPVGWEKLAEREVQFRQAEENRLLYVAATRARDQLIVSLRDRRAESNPWQRLASDAPALPDPGQPALPMEKPVSVSSEDVAAVRAAIAGRWEKIKAPTYATRAAKPAVWPVAARGDGDGMSWGSVIHLLLQTAMREPKTDLDAAAVSALRAAELDEALAGEAVATVRAVMASELWTRARAARQCLAEVPFVMTRPDGLVRGVIDLAFEENDGWVLVEYKTDQAGVAALIETYRPQLETYRDCWWVITAQKVKETGLYSTRANRYGVLK